MALITCSALYLTRDAILAIATNASSAVVDYLLTLDNSVTLILRIILMGIGYLLLVGMLGVIVYVLVAGMLIFLSTLIINAVPIYIYKKHLSENMKTGLHTIAYGFTVLSMLGLIGFVLNMLF